MNIAFLTGFIDEGIPEATKISVLSLAKELKKNSNIVIISRARSGHENVEEIENIKVYRFNKLFYPFSLFIVQTKEKLKFDIVQSFSSAPIKILNLFFFKLFSRAKLVHNIRSHSKHFLGSYKFSFFLNLADAVITNSLIIKNKLERNFCRKNILLVRSHINISDFFAQKTSQKIKTILYYGPFAKRKGAEYLMQVIPEINKTSKNIRFKFLCKTDKYDKKFYHPLIESIEKEKNVEIEFGKTEDLRGEINSAYLAVFPYPNLLATEANPLSILECAACKTPVLTSDLPEIKEIFDEKEMLFFQPRNKEDLMNKIIFALKNNEKIRINAENAHKKIKEFDIKNISKKLISIYSSLLK